MPAFGTTRQSVVARYLTDGFVVLIGNNRSPGLPTLTVDELELVSFDTTTDRHTVADTIATYTL